MDFQAIADAYVTGKSLREVATMFGTTTKMVYKALRLCGKGSRHRTIGVEIATLVEMYLSGKSCKKIGAELGIPWQSVAYRIKGAGAMRSISEAVRSKSVNHLAFASFSPESCYWAGLLAADGSIGRTSVKLALKRSDEAHVSLFARWLGWDRSLRRDRGSIVLAVGSKPLVVDLERNFNIVARKSLVLLPPLKVPANMARHFIRGYLDGDGWIGSTSAALGFAGTEQMLRWIRDELINHCAAGEPTIRKKKNARLFELTFGGRRQASSILEWLYCGSNENVRLERKWLVAQSYISTL